MVRVWQHNGDIAYVINDTTPIVRAYWSPNGSQLLTISSVVVIWHGENMTSRIDIGA